MIRRSFFISLLTAITLVLILLSVPAPSLCLGTCQSILHSETATNWQKIDHWLLNETLDWVQKDSLSRVSVIVWVDERYLMEHSFKQTRIGQLLETDYDAEIRMIGEPVLHCMIAEVPVKCIGRLSQEPFVEYLNSGTHPVYHLSEGEPPIPTNTVSYENGASSSTTTLETSMAALNIPSLWSSGYTGQGMKIAVVDTGINTTLFQSSDPWPDFFFPNGTSKIFYEWDFTSDDSPRDFYLLNGQLYHGTLVAITSAGSGRFNYRGAAPDALILNIKVINRNNYGEPQWVIDGIVRAVQQGAKVINLSLQFSPTDGTDPLSRAVDDAVKNGIVVIASAGNYGTEGPRSVRNPGCAFNVTTVGAVDIQNTAPIDDDTLWNDSSRGPTLDGRVKPDVVTPGANLEYSIGWLPAGAGKWNITRSGTSLAAPHVSGAATLVKQGHIDWSPIMVKMALKQTARLNSNLQGLSQNDRGRGIIEAYAAAISNPIILIGDINGDGMVDIYDAIRIGGAFGSYPGHPHWYQGADLNGDEIVDIYDAIILASHFGQSDGPGAGLSSGANIQVGSASLGTAIFVDPLQSIVFKNEVFTLNVKIGDVIDLYGWEFKLYWNRTVLNCTNAVIWNPTQWQNETQNYGPGLQIGYNATHGRFFKSQSALDPAPPFNGSLTIATLTFQAMQTGTTSLTLIDTKLGNITQGQPLGHTASSGSATVYYGRYMRSDTHTVNGLTAYKLGVTKSASSLFYTQTADGSLSVYWGVRAWVRHSNGGEQEISLDGQTGTPKAVVSRSTTGGGMQSNTVNVAQTTLQSTDSLVVRVYMKLGSGSWNLCATFTTEQLQATKINATTWTVYYYTDRYWSSSTNRTTGKFYWGTATYNSRMQNLQYT